MEMIFKQLMAYVSVVLQPNRMTNENLCGSDQRLFQLHTRRYYMSIGRARHAEKVTELATFNIHCIAILYYSDLIVSWITVTVPSFVMKI